MTDKMPTAAYAAGYDKGVEEGYEIGFKKGREFAARQFLSISEDLMRHADFNSPIPWLQYGTDEESAFFISKEIHRLVDILTD